MNLEIIFWPKRTWSSDKSFLHSSGASMYNFNDEEEEEDGPTKEKAEENELLKEKMKQIRLKMEKLNISKKVGNWALYRQIVICVSLALYQPSRGKTNNVVSDQVRHKPTCTVTEKS